MISKEKLIELYVDKRLTTYEIAELYDVSRKTIYRLFKRYDLKIDPSQRKYEILKKIPLTQEQKEMIVGTLLGDGHIALHGRQNKSCRLMIGHCDKQKDLVLWKKGILGNLVNIICRREDRRGNSVMWCFNTVVHNELRQLRGLFYDDAGKKVIRHELMHHITPLSLAVWLMDDGHLNKNVNIRLSTDGFTLVENQILQDILKIKFDVRSKVCEYKRNNKQYYYISINKENSIKLSNLIESFVIPCMKYKILLPHPQRLHAKHSKRVMI